MELKEEEMKNEFCRTMNCKRYSKHLILMPGYEDDIIIYCPLCLSMKDEDEHDLTLEFLRRESERMQSETRKH